MPPRSAASVPEAPEIRGIGCACDCRRPVEAGPGPALLRPPFLDPYDMGGIAKSFRSPAPRFKDLRKRPEIWRASRGRSSEEQLRPCPRRVRPRARPLHRTSRPMARGNRVALERSPESLSQSPRRDRGLEGVMRIRFMRVAVPALLAFTVAAGAFGATTGTFFGAITDSDGSALPGVTVTITSPVLQGSRTATTNAAGEYNFPLLPPGEYRAEYTLASFETVVRTGVVVNLDQSTKVNVTLALARVAESVEVTGESVVIDPTQTNTQVNLKEDHLQHATVGLARRAYQNVALETPGVTSQAGAGGNPSVFGSNLGQNSYLIDGLNTTDPITHTFTSNFTFDSIQEVAITTTGFDAEYGKAIGGIINVITKSGGNDFHGTLDARFRDESLTEQGERRRDYPPGTTT